MKHGSVVGSSQNNKNVDYRLSERGPNEVSGVQL
jgi:hypothetical protein